MKLLKNYAALSPLKRRLLREALPELVRAWALVRFGTFNKYAKDLGTAHPGAYVEDQEYPIDRVSQIRWAIETASSPFGDRFTCLMRAMAGKRMLNRRGIRNALTLGAQLNQTPGAAADMKAHAWLNVGPVVVLGGEEKDDYIAVNHYTGP